MSTSLLLFCWHRLALLKATGCDRLPSVLQVTWHPSETNVLASSGLDGSVVVFKTDGTKVKVLQHSSASSCCAWAKEGYLLATTSEAGAVYMWVICSNYLVGPYL